MSTATARRERIPAPYERRRGEMMYTAVCTTNHQIIEYQGIVVRGKRVPDPSTRRIVEHRVGDTMRLEADSYEAASRIAGWQWVVARPEHEQAKVGRVARDTFCEAEQIMANAFPAEAEA